MDFLDFCRCRAYLPVHQEQGEQVQVPCHLEEEPLGDPHWGSNWLLVQLYFVFLFIANECSLGDPAASACVVCFCYLDQMNLDWLMAVAHSCVSLFLLCSF